MASPRRGEVDTSSLLLMFFFFPFCRLCSSSHDTRGSLSAVDGEGFFFFYTRNNFIKASLRWTHYTRNCWREARGERLTRRRRMGYKGIVKADER
ncbi:hypothetical protein V8C35DRAFT_288619 [Trichoderma chlorosporum]